MLLRNSISNTKRFFQKTLRSFKSLFSGADAEPYQRLPKASPYNPYSFTAAGVAVNPNDNGNPKERNDNRKKISFSTHNIEAQRRGNNKGNVKQSTTQRRDDHQDIKQRKTRSAKVGNRREDCNSGERRREERNLSVPQKLKELEMMDMSNVEHVLDIEEVLHYYSRLTCPTYLDIVDKFFMEMYAEILGPPDSPRRVNSRPKYRSVRS
ncbi:hypothetical protein J1N35_035285 [Gossypium stocksii]|uniref:OVATE domain-containing protein n=1 Tax=Gossypium stocksii TaxID=47602 RepID=A0A9D3ZRI8_9ROSI|nr:hypothetical protein J1N35_035285 [Gossypium stocksii]